MALNQEQITKLSNIFDRYKAEVAALPSLQREFDRLVAEEAAASQELMASLKELGYDGSVSPEDFLEAVTAQVSEALSSVEAMIAPAPAPTPTPFDKPFAQAASFFGAPPSAGR